MDIVFKYIAENFPQLVAFVVVGIIVWMSAKYHFSIQSTRNKVDKLPCDGHGKKLDVLGTKVDNLQSDMGEVKSEIVGVKKDIVVLKTDVSGIKSDISGIKSVFDYTFGSPASKRKSPVTLSDLGEKIASEYNIAAIVDRNWNSISMAIDNLGTTNPYDIQEFSKETAFTDSIRSKAAIFFTEKDIDRLRLIAYKSGENIYTISFIAGILIRDRYFAENGIDVDEVDKNHSTIEDAEFIT